MPGVALFNNRCKFPEAVEASFTEDAAVVRGVVNAGDIEKLDPQLGDQPAQQISVSALIGSAVDRAIPRISVARQLSRQWMRHHLGWSSVASSAGIIRPNYFRNRGIGTHIDRKDIIGAVSINLTNGTHEPTIFYAERIADASTPFNEMVDDFRAWRATHSEPDYSVALYPGDVVVISRGVAHRVDAPPQRQTLLLGTRSLIVP